jgi:hypothetical protein
MMPFAYSNFVLLLSCLVCYGGSAELSPVFVGTLTGYNVEDWALLTAMTPVFDGIFAAFRAANTNGGGINGRRLELVTCEAAFNYTIMPNCAKNFTRDYPTMVAWTGVMTDRFVKSPVGDEFFAQDMFFVPATLYSEKLRSDFTRNWIFTNVEPQLQFMAGITAFIQRYHVRRVGFVMERIIGEESLSFDTKAAAEVLSNLGIKFTGTYILPQFLVGDRYLFQDDYEGWLLGDPQLVAFVAGPSQEAVTVFTDLLKRSASGNLSRDLMIIAPDLLVPIAEWSLQLLALGRVNYDPKGRIFFMNSNPVLTDTSYDAMQRATRELTDYLGEAATEKKLDSATFATMAAMGWIGASVLISVLRSMDVNNITKHSIKDHVFSAGMFEVDDMLFGMYTKPCSGVRAQIDLFCSCNEGYRTLEVYGYDKSVYGKLFPIPELRLTLPISTCHTKLSAVVPHLVYLVLRRNDTAERPAAAALIELGQQQEEGLSGVKNRAMYERASIRSDSDAGSVVAARCADRYVSALLAGVFGTGSINVSGYPLIDPLFFPARLTPPYEYNVLLISATLEQEMFALAQYLVETLAKDVHVMARGDQADAIAETMRRSVESFGAKLASSTSADGAALPFSSLAITKPADSALFVSGLETAADVSSLLTFLDSQQGLVAAVPFSEFSVLYSSFEMCRRDTCDRLVFATSLRNWNAQQLANESGLMADYFNALNGSGSAPRHPLTLRGFVNSVAIRRVTAEITSAYVPAAVLEKWYRIGIIILSSADFVGAYSDTRCSTATRAAELLCESNSGARVVRVMTVADVTVNAAALRSKNHSRLTVQFASYAVPYRPLPAPARWTLSTEMLVIICFLAVLLLGATFVFNKLRRTGHFTKLLTAGAGVICFQMTVHLVHIALKVFGAFAVTSASKNVVFTGFYLFLSGLGVLSNVAEMFVLYKYFEAQVNADCEMDEKTALTWQDRIAQASMVTLAAEDVPMIVIALIALLRIEVSIVLQLLFAISCFLAGTKVSTLKEVFAKTMRKLHKRRFANLKAAVAFVMESPQFKSRSLQENCLKSPQANKALSKQMCDVSLTSLTKASRDARAAGRRELALGQVLVIPPRTTFDGAGDVFTLTRKEMEPVELE